MKTKYNKFIPSCNVDDVNIAEEIRAELCAAGVLVDNLKDLVKVPPTLQQFVEWKDDDGGEIITNAGEIKLPGIYATFWDKTEYDWDWGCIVTEGETYVTLRDTDGSLRVHYSCHQFRDGSVDLFVRTRDNRELQVSIR